MTATYTNDQAASDAIDGAGDGRRRTAAPELIVAAPHEVTSTPDVPGKWSGSAKLKLILGACIGFWALVAAAVVWLVG